MEVEILAKTLPEMENKARVDPLRHKLVVVEVGTLGDTRAKVQAMTLDIALPNWLGEV